MARISRDFKKQPASTAQSGPTGRRVTAIAHHYFGAHGGKTEKQNGTRIEPNRKELAAPLCTAPLFAK
ncbi:unnamed protein product [Gongylonema pulchrum]|uniref:50S ribosomal protein L2 n=1 Tax=Gongylonema pulchrum TaxID=637853 RepID=A0A183EX77_9BILA|nr:unnamed protein product [Gongylonema pulchrum]